MNQPLIKLEGVKKVFYTDEVETHALDNINLEIAKGEYVVDCRAVGLRQVDAAVDSRAARHADRRHVRAERPAGDEPVALRARARTQPRDRIHLPELQPDRRPDRLRERRAAAHLSRHAIRRAQTARHCGARAGRHGASRQAPAQPAVRRSAAACRRRPRRLPASRRSCWPTSRPATSTRRTAKRSWTCSRSCTRSGATICMVTHDARYASHAERTIHLFDGRVVDESVATSSH